MSCFHTSLRVIHFATLPKKKYRICLKWPASTALALFLAVTISVKMRQKALTLRKLRDPDMGIKEVYVRSCYDYLNYCRSVGSGCVRLCSVEIGRLSSSGLEWDAPRHGFPGGGLVETPTRCHLQHLDFYPLLFLEYLFSSRYPSHVYPLSIWNTYNLIFLPFSHFSPKDLLFQKSFLRERECRARSHHTSVGLG